MIYTSYYASPKLRDIPKARQVAISVGVPKGWAGLRESRLAPTWAMVRMSMGERYADDYKAILGKCDAVQMASELEGCVLLCWERNPLECHRSLVADWLKQSGVEVAEL